MFMEKLVQIIVNTHRIELYIKYKSKKCVYIKYFCIFGENKNYWQISSLRTIYSTNYGSEKRHDIRQDVLQDTCVHDCNSVR